MRIKEKTREGEDVVWWVNGAEGEGAEAGEGGGGRLSGEPAEVRRAHTSG